MKIRERGSLYVIRRQGQEVSAPMIKLRGKWLRDAGLRAGQSVVVIVDWDRLTLLASSSSSETKQRNEKNVR